MSIHLGRHKQNILKDNVTTYLWSRFAEQEDKLIGAEEDVAKCEAIVNYDKEKIEMLKKALAALGHGVKEDQS